jgi:hypothetical protein
MRPLADIHRCKTGSQTNQPNESVVSVTGMAQPSSWVDFLLRWVSERLPGRQR